MQPTKRQRSSIRSRGESSFNCEICSKKFTRVENLVRHAENHKPNARFACSICAKRFTRSDILKRHLNVHRGTGGRQSAHSYNVESQLHNTQENETPDNNPCVETSWTGETPTSRDQRECYTTAPSGSYGSPLSHPSYPSLSDGCYGVYGEGSFDADLAWILDMAPSDIMAVPMPAPDDPPQINEPPTPTLALDQSGNDAPVGPAPHTPVEGGNNWPDVDGEGAPSGLQESPPFAIPRSDEWVDGQEIASFADFFGQGQVQCVSVDEDVRLKIMAALRQESSVKDGLLPPDEGKFPAAEILEHFLRLFFQHVHPRLPVIHGPTFSTTSAPPFLLLAMMLLGSSHSASDRERFVAVYLRPVSTMFSRMQTLHTVFLRETENILTLLFLCLSAAWCGHKSAFEFAEGARGILVTACRRCRLLDCRQKPSPEGATTPSVRAKMHLSWQSWIKMEQRKRLGLSIHIFDLQFPALFHNQPYISKAETVNLVLPCHESFWEAKSAAGWKVLLGPAEIPPSMYFMVPLDTCLLYPATKREPPYAPIASFGKIILMYALFTHIFEWRQTLNIVLHSAYIRGPDGTGPGEGLLERQQWLREGLAAWLKAYHRTDDLAPDAALLLHHLAQIHLDVNVSDLHLFAGRSGLSEDIKLAEDSLRRWCGSSGSARTMHNVYEMLSLAYRIIERGDEHKCGFEISVALFTGGLTCWMYTKLGGEVPVGLQINLASDALEKLTCWGICSNFAQILKRFIE